MKRASGGLALAALVAACSGGIVPQGAGPSSAGSSATPPRIDYNVPVRQPTPSTPIAPVAVATVAGATSAITAGLAAGPAVTALPLDRAQADSALAAFRISCPSLVRRTDASGLTQGADWQAACTAAASVPRGGAADFFARWFSPVQVGDGKAFATGYYIPEIHGAREKRRGYEVPIYGRPANLVDVDLGQFTDTLKGKRVRGRVEGENLVPYYDRTAIEQGALAGNAPVIAWGADPVEVFFLQIQGSGNLRLPDGGVMRLGYDDQNGRDYTGIGKLMMDRGLLGPGESSMQGIMAWLRAHPDEGRAIMRENKSFVFFRELSGPPEGAMGLPVTGGATVAVDPKFVPMGAPVLLSMDRADANGIWVAQDTGGAIKGANRFDTFWGGGDQARAIAGGMSARGTAFILLPRDTIARLTAEGRFGAPARP
ncbi:membrane-bound lytic murein transglycosylase A [Hephaestia caeni]|uniref:peptidoglycan lytic exotransglycosylase n=1 Tax=Hephaestia caeni TaxID=645617 RepID=A0A397NGX2_9SPHN|nr:murein transglycosylase A [Hephaestia caeni]RIA36740.1 membrane-bound lytic murein transglycosylase A [Hephaestia caeni]